MNSKIYNRIKSVFAAGIFLAVTALGFTGCLRDNNPPMISLSREIVRVDASAQSISVTVMSNTEWTASTNDSWIRISQASGRGTTTVSLIIEDYAATTERQGSVSFSIGDTDAKITILQSAANGILIIAPEQMTVGAQASVVYFAVSCNGDWTASSSNGWAVPAPASGTGNGIVTVTVGENVSHSTERKATISVSTRQDDGTSIVKEFVVNQISRDLPSVTLAQNKVWFEADAKTAGTGTVVIPVVTNITGEIVTTCDLPWCNASYADGKLTISVEDNNANEARQAIVTIAGNVEGEAIMQQVTVYQAGLGSPEIQIVKKFFVLPASAPGDETTQHVTVAFNTVNKGTTCRVVEDYPDWITNATITDGFLKFDVLANVLPEDRQTTVSIEVSLGTEKALYPVSVLQCAEQDLEVSLSQEYVNFGSGASTAEVAAFSNVRSSDLSADVLDADWCTVTVTSVQAAYDNNFSIKINAEENPYAEARAANIAVYVGSENQRVVKSIAVNQAGVGGPDIKVLEESLVLPSAGTTEQDGYAVNFVGMDTRTTLKVSSSQSWVNGVISADKTKLIAVAQENMSSKERTATLTIVAEKGGQTQIIPVGVTQLGTGMAELEFERTSYTFPSDAASYVAFVKALNGTKYSVVLNPEWMKVEQNDNVTPTTLTIKLEKNADAQSREGKIVLLAKNGDDSRYYTIAVSQDGVGSPAVYAVCKNVTVGHAMHSNNETYKVRVIGAESSETTLEVTSSDSWVHTLFLEEDQWVRFCVDDNKTLETRVATITLLATRGGEIMTTSFTVTQLGTGDPGIEFAALDYSVPAKGTDDDGKQTLRIPVASVNSSTWAVASTPSWANVDETNTNKGQVALIIDQNTDAQSRSGEIMFYVNNYEYGSGSETSYASVSITQAGVGGPNVIPVTQDITFTREGTEGVKVLCLNIKDVDNVRYTCSESWVNKPAISQDGTGRLVFTVTGQNDSKSSRTAIITAIFTKGGEDQTLDFFITQLGTGAAGLEFVSTQYNVPAPQSVLVIPFVELNDSFYEVAEKPDWITVDETADTYIKVTASSNEESSADRTGSIVFKVRNAQNNADEYVYQTVTVTQDGMGGPNLVPLTNKLTFAKEADLSKTVKFLNSENVKFVAWNSTADWVSAEGTADAGSQKFTVSAANTGVSARYATVSLVAKKGDQTQIIDFQVTQLGTGSAGLVFETESVNLPAVSTGVKTINLITLNSTEYTVASTPSWIHIQGTLAQTGFTFTYDNNTNAEDRSGEIIFKVMNSLYPDEVFFQTLPVTQAGVGGPNVTPVATDLTFVQNPSTASETKQMIRVLNFDGTIDFQFTSSDDWVSGSYSDQHYFEFTVNSANNAAEARTAIVTAIGTKGDKEQVLNFNITQMGTGTAGLEFAAASYEFPAASANGGKPQLFVSVVKLNGSSYSISSKPGWITPTVYGDGIVFTADVNTAAEERTGTVILKVENAGDVTYQTIAFTQAGVGGPNVSPVTSDLTFVQNPSGDAQQIQYIPCANFDSGTAVIFTCNASWVKVNNTCPTIKFTVADANTSADTRNAIVTATFVKGDEKQFYTFTVKQLGTGSPEVVFASNYYGVASGVTTVSVPYTNVNADEITETYKDPLITNVNLLTAGVATLTLATNTSTEAQSGNVVFKATRGGETVYYTVTVERAGLAGPNVVLGSSGTVYDSDDTGTRYISYTNDNGAEVKAFSSKSWLVVETPSDGKIAFYPTSENTTTKAYTAQITVVATKGGESQMLTYTVTHLGTGSPKVELSVNQVVSDASAGTCKVTVVPAANTTIGAPMVNGGTWLTATSVTDNNFEISLDSNDDTSTRYGEVVILATAGDETVLYTIPVTQYGSEGPAISTAVSQLSVSPYASTGNTIVYYGQHGTVSATADVDWITANAPADGKVVFSATTNNTGAARTGHITLVATYDNQTVAKAVTISQAAAGDPQLVVVAPKDTDGQYHFTVDAKGTTLTVPLIGDNFDITSSEYPFDVVTKYGNQISQASVSNATLTIKVEENTSAKQYEGVVYIGVKKTGAQSAYGDYYQMIPVYVTQLSTTETYTLEAPSLLVVDKNTTVETNMQVVTDLDATATVYPSDSPWITLSSYSITSSTNAVKVTTAAVTDGKDRTGYIVFSNGKGCTATVTVQQK